MIDNQHMCHLTTGRTASHLDWQYYSVPLLSRFLIIKHLIHAVDSYHIWSGRVYCGHYLCVRDYIAAPIAKLFETALHVSKLKHSGLVLYDVAFDAGLQENLGLASELKAALQNRQLSLYLQPKIHIQFKRGYAAEALMRWIH